MAPPRVLATGPKRRGGQKEKYLNHLRSELLKMNSASVQILVQRRLTMPVCCNCKRVSS